MPIESSFNYPSDLNASYPQSGDSLSVQDDHTRGIKNVIKTTLPNVSGAITATHTELNYVDGVTSNVQTQLNAITSTGKGLELIAASSASAVAAVDFTSGIGSSYEEYELHIINAVPVISSKPLLQASTNAGSSFLSASGDYSWIGAKAASTSMSVANDGGTATAITLHDQNIGTGVSGANIGFNSVVRIFDPAGTTLGKAVTAQSAATGSGNNREASTVAGQVNTATAVNALRFMFSTGNIASGKFKLYGVKKAL
jgi:hypothetical protein